jgi:membrane fusion protein
MNSPLFRSEALAARGSQWLGPILLARPVPMRIAATVAAMLAIALIIFLYTGVYTSRVRVQGQLLPATGAVRVSAPQFGRVTASHVREGEHVEAGKVLYEISATRMTADGNLDDRILATLEKRRLLLAQEQQLQVQQANTQEQALIRRRTLAEASIRRLENEIALQRSRAATSNAMLARYTTLHEEGFLPQLQLMQHQAERDDQLSRVQVLERTILDARRELTQTDAEIAQVRTQSSINAIQARRALEGLVHESAEQQGRQRIQVLAPAAGTATALLATVGQTVAPGAQLLSIVPDNGGLEAHLYAPTSAIGFVTEGQPVRLMIAAFPYQKFGYVAGTVTRVEQDTIAAPNATAASPAPVYRITVSLSQQGIAAHGKRHRLLPGMTLDAEIRQEQRRLFEWLVAPILPATQGDSTAK